MAMTKDAEANIAQLQILEQNFQQLSAQKQQFNLQLLEVDSALKEIKGSEECYRIIGSVMVASKRDEIEKELSEKKEMLELRIKSIEKQEEKINSRAKDLRQAVLEGMEENGTKRK